MTQGGLSMSVLEPLGGVHRPLTGLSMQVPGRTLLWVDRYGLCCRDRLMRLEQQGSHGHVKVTFGPPRKSNCRYANKGVSGHENHTVTEELQRKVVMDVIMIFEALPLPSLSL